MKLSILIPAYNEEKTIQEIIQRVNKEVQIPKVEKEIVVTDDGSIDSTASQVLHLQKNISEIKLIKHRKNKGKGAAIQSGIKEATGDIIVIQDADLEYNPEDIPRLVKPVLDKKALVVYGTRLRMKPTFFGKNKTPFLLHFFGNKFLSFITTLLYGYTVTDMETGYKIFDKKALNGIRLRAKSFDFEPEITAKILKKKIKIKELDIKTHPRSYKEGKKLRTFHDGFIALWTLIKYRFTN